MKRLLNTQYQAQTFNFVLFFARVFISALMLVHGLPKFMKLISSEPIQFADPIGVGMETSLFLAVFSEFFCSILIMLGLYTRLASIPLIITMLVAVFQVHLNDPFSKQEMGLHYLLVYFIILIAGAGKYSLDYLLFEKKGKSSV